MDDLAILRRRVDDLGRRIDAGRNGGRPGAAALVGRVVDAGAMPNRVPGYYTLQPQRIGGPESEGSAIAATDVGPRVVALVVGQRVPAAGDRLIARLIGGRWVAETKQGAGSGVSVPGCTCANMPTTLSLAVTNSALSFGILQSATLQWGPTPAVFSRLSLGANSYLSTTSFNDQTTSDQFWYYFACLGGYYILARVYKTSVYGGSPYRDTVRYKWLVGNTGNTCVPFKLKNGQIYSGGNALCTAEIT